MKIFFTNVLSSLFILSFSLLPMNSVSAAVQDSIEVYDTVPEVKLDILKANKTVKEDQDITQVGKDKDFVLLDFFSVTCGPCRVNLPKFSKLAKAIKDTTTTRAVSISTELQTTRYVENNREYFTYDVAFDQNRKAFTRVFKLRFTPTTILLNKERTVIYKHIGTLSDDDIEDIKNLVK